ncbi:MAG: hypothetical protein J6Y53_04705 [Alphaproteobacteria bacterium]|nr:hypothetical protein [Alphaproteobacteria bacterium]
MHHKHKIKPCHKTKRLQTIWKFLTSDSMAFLMGIVAIIIGYYQFYISRPILEYSTSTDKIISTPSSGGMKLHINGAEYQDIYKSLITLTNSGEEALSGSDVSPIGHDPIRIPIPPRVKILSYNIDSENTSPEIDAQLKKIGNDIIITFSFLNPKNSIGINLFTEHDYDQYKIIGSAVGVNKILPALSGQKYKKIIALNFLVLLLCGIIGIFIFRSRRRRIPRI